MATYYIDFEGGNDASDGLSFANRWKTISNGATAARIAPGDTIRIMGSPAPTSLGQNGVWISSVQAPIKFISSTTNATPIGVTSTAHGYSTGDTVNISGVTGGTAANGTWEITVTGPNTFTLDGSSGNGTGSSGTVRLKNNCRVMLETAVTQEIASTGPRTAAWTSAGGANVTTTLSATTKEHYQSDQIAIGAGFTTGLAAYWTLPSSLDLSGYQQVSFWIRQNSGTVGAAGSISLRLCSDAAGATTVNTINIPNLVRTGRWASFVVDTGAALGASINSIALYVDTDNGAQTFLFSNIIACKASSSPDSLNLTSLIGKNTTGETFWCIQSIRGKRVMLDMETNSTPDSPSVRGYYGATETVTTYKRETIKIGPGPSFGTLQEVRDSGSPGAMIKFEGGWDRTDMSTKTLETWMDGVNGSGYMLSSYQGYIDFSGVAFVRAEINLYWFGGNSQVSIIASNSSTSGLGPAYVTGVRSLFLTFGHAVANGGSLYLLGNTGTVTIDHAVVSNSGTGVTLGMRGLPHEAIFQKGTGLGLIASNGTGMDLLDCGNCLIKNISFAGNSYSISANKSSGPVLMNCKLDDSLEFATFPGSETVYSHNHDQVAGSYKIFMNGAVISSAVDQRYTPSGYSWKIQITSSARDSSWPIVFYLAEAAVSANALVTVKLQMRRSNTGLTMRLVCKGGQIAGVNSDVVSAMTASADTWSEQTITFTPTEAGVVEITVEAWGGTSYSGWVDDLLISQA